MKWKVVLACPVVDMDSAVLGEDYIGRWPLPIALMACFPCVVHGHGRPRWTALLGRRRITVTKKRC